MKRFVDALVKRMTEGGAPQADREINLDLSGAPQCVRRLAEALASDHRKVDLGAYLLRARETPVVGLEGTLEAAVEDRPELGALDELLKTAGIDPARTLHVVDERGGNCALGFGWKGDDVFAVVVELEDPTEENLLQVFTTPAALVAYLDEVQGGITPDVRALAEASGGAPPAPAQPSAAGPVATTGASALSAWNGSPPADPFAESRAFFQYPRQLFQVGPTAGGRLVFAQRRRFAPSEAKARVVARAPEGAVTKLAWKPNDDVYGLGLVPGRERAVVCNGNPGTLFEFDLVTGTARKLLARVGWGGFLDDQHFVVRAAPNTGPRAELHVYRYREGELGAPVFVTPYEQPNLFARNGYAFGRDRGDDLGFRVLRWSNGALADLGTQLVEGGEDLSLFGLDAAVMHEGRLLIGAASEPPPVWVAFEPTEG